MINKNIALLIGITLLAVVFRFFQLGANPPALTWDEVSWGINAYSLGMSARDEFGEFLPVTYLESFGDFKPPLYAYLTVIPVWIFGLNEFSVRFMSAFLGSLTVLVSYFLSREIFYTLKKKEIIALITAFLLAISPWHILLSRGAFEANVAQFFIVLGVFLFLFSTRDKKNIRYLILSLLSFVFAMYTFNTSRVFLPLFVLFLFILKHKILIQNWKKTTFELVIPFVLSIPLVLFMLTPQAQLRYQEVNIFSDITVIERTNQEMENSGNSLVSKIIHNRRFAYAVEYVQHYLDHFSPSFLFISGDGNPKFAIQDVGQMYTWELPFLVAGILLLFRKKEGYWFIVPVWIVLGIIPAATARETPHALRIETIVPTLQIVTAYGFFSFAQFVKKTIQSKNMRRAVYLFVAMVAALNVMYFIHNYINYYPIKYASEWQYGYKEAIKYTEENKNNYEKIYFTQDLGRPYAYVLMYGGYPVNILQTDADIRREALGFVHVDRLGKYHFPKVLPNDSRSALFVSVPDKTPGDANILKTIYLPDGKPSLVVYEK